ncbi:MAG: hypothetical protein PVJ65_05970 [Chromatiales bacterium]
MNTRPGIDAPLLHETLTERTRMRHDSINIDVYESDILTDEWGKSLHDP